MKTFWTRYRYVIWIVLVTALLHAWASWQLPIDFDEPVYLQAGFDYSRLLRAGDWNGVIDYRENLEHPPLVKLLYSLPALVQGENAERQTALFASRAISSFFGTLAVLLVAIVNPLAGLFLALQTLVVKFTSQAYLEGLPLFTSIAAVLAMLRSRLPRDRWFWLSALALGATAAGKYSYFPILFVVLFIFLSERRYRWTNLLPFLAVAGLTFWALDPALWHDPLNRLAQSVLFHTNYSQSAHVQQAGYPWYQPFLWVSRSWAYYWHPEVFVYLGIDGLIATCAVIGLKEEWFKERWVIVWLVVGMVFLLAWPTKWPQYTLVVIPAICFAGAAGVKLVYNWLREQETYWEWISKTLHRPSKAWGLAAIAIIAVVTLGQVANTMREAANHRGWWHLTTENSVLPSNIVYSVLREDDQRMLVGTDRGVVDFTLSKDTGLPGQGQVITPQNSGLPGERIQALLKDQGGALWFGTQNGLARYSAGEWRTFRAADFGLVGEQINALVETTDGRIWVGTNAGLAVYDGQTWQAFTHANSSMADDYVLSLAAQPASAVQPASQPQAAPTDQAAPIDQAAPVKQTVGEGLWVGTQSSLSHLDFATGAWTAVKEEGIGKGSGGIADLLVDTRGRLWVATLGSGLLQWNGQAWDYYRVSNSKIPSNTVLHIEESEPDVFWVSTAIPNQAGGVLSRVTGVDWKNYLPKDSGFSGSEPLSISRDINGRLWIGTRTTGIDIYQEPEGSK